MLNFKASTSHLLEKIVAGTIPMSYVFPITFGKTLLSQIKQISSQSSLFFKCWFSKQAIFLNLTNWRNIVFLFRLSQIAFELYYAKLSNYRGIYCSSSGSLIFEYWFSRKVMFFNFKDWCNTIFLLIFPRSFWIIICKI